jgi:hypothetical protein
MKFGTKYIFFLAGKQRKIFFARLIRIEFGTKYIFSLTSKQRKIFSQG